MNHLPQYWAIKIDKEHPLWERFVKYILDYTTIFQSKNTDYKYIGKIKKEGMYQGYDMSEKLENLENICSVKPLPLITLEQFFGETQFEIY